MQTKLLQPRDLVAAAFELECEVAAIQAVCEVEAPRGGFANGVCLTLFEGHIFHKYTKGRFAEKYPTISYKSWTTQHYGKTPAKERERLALAMTLDMNAALMSASWGKFQIMGFNFALCGYTNVVDFVRDMEFSEDAQLDAFVEYIKNVGLADELQEHRWHDFARKYNGPEYMKNKYADKLEAAYKKHLASGI
jgi:hypothetical protein